MNTNLLSSLLILAEIIYQIGIILIAHFATDAKYKFTRSQLLLIPLTILVCQLSLWGMKNPQQYSWIGVVLPIANIYITNRYILKLTKHHIFITALTTMVVIFSQVLSLLSLRIISNELWFNKDLGDLFIILTCNVFYIVFKKPIRLIFASLSAKLQNLTRFQKNANWAMAIFSFLLILEFRHILLSGDSRQTAIAFYYFYLIANAIMLAIIYLLSRLKLQYLQIEESVAIQVRGQEAYNHFKTHLRHHFDPDQPLNRHLIKDLLQNYLISTPAHSLPPTSASSPSASSPSASSPSASSPSASSPDSIRPEPLTIPHIYIASILSRLEESLHQQNPNIHMKYRFTGTGAISFPLPELTKVMEVLYTLLGDICPDTHTIKCDGHIQEGLLTIEFDIPLPQQNPKIQSIKSATRLIKGLLAPYAHARFTQDTKKIYTENRLYLSLHISGLLCNIDLCDPPKVHGKKLRHYQVASGVVTAAVALSFIFILSQSQIDRAFKALLGGNMLVIALLYLSTFYFYIWKPDRDQNPKTYHPDFDPANIAMTLYRLVNDEKSSPKEIHSILKALVPEEAV